MPLAVSRMSGSTPQCSTAHILPVRPGARLDLVGDEQDAVLVADRAEALEEAVLGDDVAALALDRLDDDRRDLVGRGELVEQDLVEPAQVLDLARTARGRSPGSSGPNPAWYFAFEAVSETEP